MGNRHTTQVTETEESTETQLSSSFCSFSLKKLITKTSSVKIFKATEQREQKKICLITFCYTPDNGLILNTYEKYTSFLAQLHHPCLVDTFSYYLPHQENHSESFSGAVMVQSCDTCLSNLLNPLVTTYRYDNTVSSSYAPIIAAKHNTGVFEENDILNMVFSIVEAVMYCYEKGINVKVSEQLILICQEKQKFVLAPFCLDEKEPFSASFLQSETPLQQSQDEDIAENRDIKLKKEIFKIGVSALKMATLYNFEADLDTVKHLLEGIKENYPSLEKILQEIMFEIFSEEYDIKPILKKFSSYENVHLKLASDIFRSIPTEDLSDQDIEYQNSLEGQLEFGYAYTTGGSFEAALKVLQNVELMYFNKSPQMTTEEQKELANVLEKLAESSVGLKQEEQAAEYIIKTVELRERIIKQDDPQIIDIYHSAGLLFERNEECKKAVDFLVKASEHCEPFEGDDDSFYEKQILIHKDLLRVKEKAFGKENLSYAESLERMSLSLEALGKVDEALDVRNQIKDLYENHLGGKDGAFINNLIKIGELLCLSFDYTAAMKIYNECLELSKSAYGKESVKYARCLKKIGQVYQKKKHYHTAITYYDQTLKIRKQLFGISHKKTLNIIIALAKCHEKGKSNEKALEYYQQALEGLRKRKGQKLEDYSKVCFKVAKMLESKHDIKSSSEYYRECFGMFGAKNKDWYSFDLLTKQGPHKLVENNITSETRG